MSTPQENLPIRFLRSTRYGLAGEINSQLSWGVRATLVDYRKAEWVYPEKPKMKPKRGTSDE